MLYHQILIFLNRPFVSSDKDLTMGAGQACTNSARDICRMLRLYRRLYTLRYINVQAVATTMIAGVVHVHDCCTYSGTKGKLAQDNLLICIQALGEMGQCFNSSIRGLEVITTLRRAWQIQKFRETGPKRHRSTSSSSTERNKKSTHSNPGPK